MTRHRVEMAITGAEVSPERVSVRDLVDILSRVERAVLSYAESKLIEPSEEPTLSLVEIRAGSEYLTFSVSDQLLHATAQISKAIELRDYADLPEPTYTALYCLAESVTKRGWGFEIQENPDYDIPHARIDTESMLPPREAAFVKGTTTLHGRCLRVGGAVQPKAEIRLSTTGRILNVDLSEGIARELATRLYEEVVLEGSVTWNMDSWEIERFRVSHITAFRKTEPDLAFKELAEAAQGRWEGVDAAEYVRELRSDD